MPGLPAHYQLPEFTQTHVHWVRDAIQPSHLLPSPSPPTLNLSQHQGLFKWVSFSHQVAKILEFQLQHQSFQWILRTDPLLDGLVGSPCSPRDSQESSTTPQFKSISFQCSAFFIAQLSHPYMTTSKIIALTRWAFVCKVMSLLFNMLPRLVITFLPRSKRLLISWLQSLSAVILEARKIKSATVSPSICHEVMGPDAMILFFWMLSFKPTFSLSSFTFIKRLFTALFFRLPFLLSRISPWFSSPPSTNWAGNIVYLKQYTLISLQTSLPSRYPRNYPGSNMSSDDVSNLMLNLSFATYYMDCHEHFP